MRTIMRQILLTSCWLVSPACAVWAASPNVVIILADDMGFSDAGCYGGEIQTPNLDQLAAHGLRFTQFYNTARCWPTRSAIMTGYYPQQIRMDPPRERLPAWASLLPHHLRPLGYRCYHVGKWHVTGAPRPVADGGFDRSYWFEDWDRYFSPSQHFADDVQLPPVAPDSGYYATTAFADRAIGYLQDHAEQHADQPFFSVPGVHLPAFPAARAAGRHRPVSRPVPGGLGRRSAGSGGSGCGRWASSIATSPRWTPELQPRYFKPELLETVGPGEIAHAVAWSELTRRAETIPGDEDGDPRGDGRPDGPRDRPGARPVAGHERLRQHGDLLSVRQRSRRDADGARRGARPRGRTRVVALVPVPGAGLGQRLQRSRFGGTRSGSTRVASRRR